MEHTKWELKRGCVIFMKASSGLTGYGNKQCISSICEELGTVSLFGHNQHYKTYDIDRIVEYPIDKDSHDDLLAACKAVRIELKLLRGLAELEADICVATVQERINQINFAIAKAEKS